MFPLFFRGSREVKPQSLVCFCEGHQLTSTSLGGVPLIWSRPVLKARRELIRQRNVWPSLSHSSAKPIYDNKHYRWVPVFSTDGESAGSCALLTNAEHRGRPLRPIYERTPRPKQIVTQPWPPWPDLVMGAARPGDCVYCKKVNKTHGWIIAVSCKHCLT